MSSLTASLEPLDAGCNGETAEMNYYLSLTRSETFTFILKGIFGSQLHLTRAKKNTEIQMDFVLSQLICRCIFCEYIKEAEIM